MSILNLTHIIIQSTPKDLDFNFNPNSYNPGRLQGSILKNIEPVPIVKKSDPMELKNIQYDNKAIAERVKKLGTSVSLISITYRNVMDIKKSIYWDNIHKELTKMFTILLFRSLNIVETRKLATIEKLIYSEVIVLNSNDLNIQDPNININTISDDDDDSDDSDGLSSEILQDEKEFIDSSTSAINRPMDFMRSMGKKLKTPPLSLIDAITPNIQPFKQVVSSSLLPQQPEEKGEEKIEFVEQKKYFRLTSFMIH